jgi:hypothetical protein
MYICMHVRKVYLKTLTSSTGVGEDEGSHKPIKHIYKSIQIYLRLLHMMNVRFSLLNMAQRILGVTLPIF